MGDFPQSVEGGRRSGGCWLLVVGFVAMKGFVEKLKLSGLSSRGPRVSVTPPLEADVEVIVRCVLRAVEGEKERWWFPL